MTQKRKKDKGAFSGIRLPIANRYITPASGRLLPIVAGAIALLMSGILFVTFLGEDGTIVANGPLSSGHANFGNDCMKCHTSLSLSEGIMAGVDDNKCLSCHKDASGEVRAHEFAGHYLYRSADRRRTTVRDSISKHETACYSCHQEHNGREASIINVSDAQCLTCHQYGSFNEEHPQFQFARENIDDAANLKFTHIFHVKELLRRGKVETREAACISCHQPQSGGKNFQPIVFANTCSDCHLGISNPTPTAELALKSKRRSGVPGVLSLKAIEKSRRPGTAWAKVANPVAFETFGNAIVKQILEHKDPWLLYNLRLLRQEMFPEAGLADLLESSGDVARNQSTQLYREAISQLEAQLRELHSHPSRQVQDDLERISDELQLLKKLLRNPADTQLDHRKFSLGSAEMAAAFQKSEKRLAKYRQFVDVLTAECQTCHVVENATILRVQKDQRVLNRAEFNHQSHVLQSACLDCHQEIDFDTFSEKTDIPAAVDNAAIQNIPAIETCVSCHTQKAASNQCITCHQFHPNKSHNNHPFLKVESSW